jgi:hypothetical protein
MNLLLFIAHHYNSCLYGTFLFNSEFERVERNATERYSSIWTDVYKNISQYLNLIYDPTFKEVLVVNFSFYRLRFWEEYFLSKFITVNNGNDNVKVVNDKMNELTEVMNEVYLKIKDKDVFETLSNKAKNYLNIFKK